MLFKKYFNGNYYQNAPLERLGYAEVISAFTAIFSPPS